MDDYFRVCVKGRKILIDRMDFSFYNYSREVKKIIMEQGETISFASVIAGMLLCKRYLTSREIVNFISKLNCEGFYVDDSIDSDDDIYKYVEIGCDYSFYLRNDLNYDSVLLEGITLRNYLINLCNPKVFDIIRNDDCYKNYLGNDDKSDKRIKSWDKKSKNYLYDFLIEKGEKLVHFKEKRCFNKIKKRNIDIGYHYL